MNPGEHSIRENERQSLLSQLDAAESALRANQHRHGVDPIARAHTERALAHVREAYIAINEGRARTVEQLTHDLAKVEQLSAKLRRRPRVVNSKSVRV
jgi:hypothetical protein